MPDFIFIISPIAATSGTFSQSPGPWQERNLIDAREFQDHFQVTKESLGTDEEGEPVSGMD